MQTSMCAEAKHYLIRTRLFFCFFFANQIEEDFSFKLSTFFSYVKLDSKSTENVMRWDEHKCKTSFSQFFKVQDQASEAVFSNFLARVLWNMQTLEKRQFILTVSSHWFCICIVTPPLLSTKSKSWKQESQRMWKKNCYVDISTSKMLQLQK